MEQLTNNGALRLDFNKVKAAIQAGGASSLTRERSQYDSGDLSQMAQMIAESMCDGKFILDNNNKDVFENFRRWCDGSGEFYAIDPATHQKIAGDPKKGIYIGGNPGTGKTLFTAIFSRYASLLNLRWKRVDGSIERLSWTSYFATEICDRYAKTGDISEIARTPSLCIQDIGSEPKETIFMGNRKSVIEELLQQRGERKDYITILTANYSIEENIYGDRVTSRLHQMCNYYELKGKDRRYGK